jgi:hypothetical protein
LRIVQREEEGVMRELDLFGRLEVHSPGRSR